jgi:hypothetical protein
MISNPPRTGVHNILMKLVAFCFPFNPATYSLENSVYETYFLRIAGCIFENRSSNIAKLLDRPLAFSSTESPMRTIKTTMLVALAMSLFACANPSIVNVKRNEVGAISDASKIYIPRFEGNPDFAEESTDFFVSGLESKISHRIIQGGALRNEDADIRSGRDLAPLTIALESARNNGADILITGKVTSHRTSGMINGFSTIRIYNVNTGSRIANFHRPSGLLIGNSEHQCVMASVGRAVVDVAELFKR